MAPKIFDDPRFKEELDAAVSSHLTEKPLSFLMKVRIIQFGGTAAAAAAGAVAAIAALSIWPWIEKTAQDAAVEAAETAAVNTARDTALETASFVSATRAADILLANENFKADVAQGALGSLSGSVVAFVDKCPTDGWTPFTDGAGKFLLGVGEGTLVYSDDSPHRPPGEPNAVRLSPVSPGQQGGEERHTLTEPEMPTHDHGGHTGDDVLTRPSYGNWTDAGADSSHRAGGSGVGMHNETKHTHGIADEGGGEPHNNMPPYIALYFCKKE